MKKPVNAYNKYYHDKKSKGYKSTLVFGPPELIEATKEFVRQYKTLNDLYVYNRKKQ